MVYLRQVYLVSMPPNPLWNCKLSITAMNITTMCSTLFILSMTFERSYSIVRPHKAASFNKVKRAKHTIICCVIFSFLFNLPHLFLSRDDYPRCIPYSSIFRHFETYFWLSFVFNFILPFIFLLTMNIIIIHTLRKRSRKIFRHFEGHGKGQKKGQISKVKNMEKQIYITLLLVTCGFLVLTTPLYLVIVLVVFSIVNRNTPRGSALFYLLYHVAQKSFYTNNGINFFFYVMSGQKFRTYLLKLLHCCKDKTSDNLPTSSLDSLASHTS